jgi:glutamate N-acetyltransferase/amino-acid acetyltransferase
MTFSFLAHGHVTSPEGFRAATAECGIKYTNRADLALIVSDRPCSAAAIFTTNKVKAAPVLFDQALIKRNNSNVRAVVINSGNANACTGPAGLEAAATTAKAVESTLGLPADSTFVMSTGVIGVQLPVDKILARLPEISIDLVCEGGPAAAQAIMTTDTRPKTCAVEVSLPSGSKVKIGGMAKGAGMIAPNMATMLSVITTDASITPEVLDSALRRSADVSFNSMTIDGDTSTNDTLLLLANGASKSETISDLDSPDGQAWYEGLVAICQKLAQEVARDGEGATRFVTITVRGAVSDAEARQAAMTVANSPLVKTALFGADPNWGRVLMALGRSGVELDQDKVSLFFGGLKVLEGGIPVDFDEIEAHKLLDVPEVKIEADLNLGDGQATVWTCDFSYDYVKINAEYRT